jgi:hypothetical protein
MMVNYVSGLEVDFIQAPSDVFAIAGRPATLNCSPPTSVPTVTVTWYKDNEVVTLRSGERSLSIPDAEAGIWDLYFTQVQQTDEGEYFCVAENGYAIPATRTSPVVMLSVGGTVHEIDTKY